MNERMILRFTPLKQGVPSDSGRPEVVRYTCGAGSEQHGQRGHIYGPVTQTARGGERGKHGDDDLHNRAPGFFQFHGTLQFIVHNS